MTNRLVTRRQALEALGIGATAAALPASVCAQEPGFPKGSVIRAILKDYAPEELAGGATLFHEHMQLGADFNAKFGAATAAARAANGLPPLPGRGGPAAPKGPDIMRDVDLMSAEVAKTKADGVACIVDGGHPDMGRDINFIRQVFRAIGKAHVATNLPIFTHTGIPGKSALEQLDILEDAGVKPDRVVIGHLGNLVDSNVYVHKQICRRGAFVGFDRQGGNNDTQQVPMVMALIEAGFADHLMFSADASSGYSKTLTVFLPKLKAAGASDPVLHGIMVNNPRRFLAFVPKRPRKKA